MRQGGRPPQMKGRARCSVRLEEGRFMAKDGEKVRKKSKGQSVKDLTGQPVCTMWFVLSEMYFVAFEPPKMPSGFTFPTSEHEDRTNPNSATIVQILPPLFGPWSLSLLICKIKGIGTPNFGRDKECVKTPHITPSSL